jgi:hypothetical protein
LARRLVLRACAGAASAAGAALPACADAAAAETGAISSGPSFAARLTAGETS